MENVKATATKNIFTTKQMVLIGVVTAITCILAPMSVPLPITPVPISLTNLVLYVSVFLLGWKSATVSYIVYLLIGFAGLPVFSGFTGGLAKLAGPTGGYLIGMIFRVAQGSGTVAGMTSMTIMATVAPAIGCHPVWLALACLSGGNSIGHVNDSGFWVATNMSGLTVTGGLKTYTLGSFISSVCMFVLALIGALVIPL